MLLDTTTLMTPATFTVGPIAPPAPEPTPVRVPGATLLVAPQATPAAAEAALKTLRGLRAGARCAVWCNPTDLTRTPGMDFAQLGRRLVADGGVELVVVCGQGGRELAMAVRDAGLPLGRVIVCRDEATARNILGDSIHAGDVVLALGIGHEGCQRLADRLESRFSRKPAAVA